MRGMTFGLAVGAALIAGCQTQQTQPPPPLFVPTRSAPTAADIAKINEPKTSRLVFVSPDGSLNLLDPADLSVTTVAMGVASWVQYSDDGTRLAYRAERGGLLWYDLVERVGHIAAHPSPSRHEDDECAISPDGLKVAHQARVMAGGEFSEYRLHVWTRDEGTEMIEGLAGCDALAWSPDSTRLAIGAMAGRDTQMLDGGVWVWDGKGEPREVIPSFGPGGGTQHELMWSPDGEWIATRTHRPDAARPTHGRPAGDLVRADGSELKRDVLAGGVVAWLPDGERLIVGVPVEGDPDANYVPLAAGVYLLSDGSVTPIGDQSGSVTTCLSPDGARVLIDRSDDPGRTAVVDLTTMEETAWEVDLEGAHGPAWSESGTVAAMVVLPLDAIDLKRELWLVNIETEAVLKTGIAVGVESLGASLRWIEVAEDDDGALAGTQSEERELE